MKRTANTSVTFCQEYQHRRPPPRRGVPILTIGRRRATMRSGIGAPTDSEFFAEDQLQVLAEILILEWAPEGPAAMGRSVGDEAGGERIIRQQQVHAFAIVALAFVVAGLELLDAGIFDEDLVVVRKQSTANPGDIVVALIGEEATVKTFYRESGRVRLQPENSALEPIYADHVQVLGKVVGVFRSLR